LFVAHILAQQRQPDARTTEEKLKKMTRRRARLVRRYFARGMALEYAAFSYNAKLDEDNWTPTA